MPLLIENLILAPAMSEEGKFEGGKIPHSSIRFKFGPTAAPEAFNLDDWTNHKPAAKDPLRAAAGRIAHHNAVVQSAVKSWACNTCLMDELLDTLWLTGAAVAQKPADRYAPPGDGGAYIDIPLAPSAALTDPHDQTLAKCLTAAAAASYWRLRTIDALSLGTLTVTTTKGVQATEKAILCDWGGLMTAMRRGVKSRIVNSSAPPRKYAETKQDTDLLDNFVFDVVERNTTFKPLVASKVLRAESHGFGYEIVNTADAHLGGAAADKPAQQGLKGKLTTAFNHVRFAAYIEWRLGYELYHQSGGILTD